MSMGRVGGRVRKTTATRKHPPGKAGRPGRIKRVEALVDLLGGTASVDQLAERLGVRAATITRWREEALPHVGRALLDEREAPRVAQPPGGRPRTTGGSIASRASKLSAMRVFLLEEYVRVSKPGPEQVAALSRQTPHGRVPVAVVCTVFGVGRTAYYEASRKRKAKSERPEGARRDR